MITNNRSNGNEEEIAPMVTGCATLVSAAVCGMVLLMVLVLGVVLLFVTPAVAESLAQRGAQISGITAFVLGIAWWMTLLVGAVIAGFVIIKELAISHALANFIINVLILLLLLGFAVLVAVALLLPYVQSIADAATV